MRSPRSRSRRLRNKAPLRTGQKDGGEADPVASGDRVVGVQGYAGSGKTTMLEPRPGAGSRRSGYRGAIGLAPSASARAARWRAEAAN